MKSRIYTRTGDFGKTSLFGGKRVLKNNLRIEAYGSIDELNSLIGISISLKPKKYISNILVDLQGLLFVFGGDLATPINDKIKISRITQIDIEKIEKLIDDLDVKLNALKNFILPGGTVIASILHYARGVARRAERNIVALSEKENIGVNPVKFINRLNDLLFVLARFENKLQNKKEIIWKSEK